ncbi:YhcN/YlaJ family sporulation lipoprotein [Effusibacillus pohliae]|uniref:YhcN/YlaJ family sporulation lipoprotein n=1 Tax=Effusibacillus pohliae TaxID=232270 RepID=UPI000377DFCD|nr:hypothetical protein [Effusibacillus pohliae]
MKNGILLLLAATALTLPLAGCGWAAHTKNLGQPQAARISENRPQPNYTPRPDMAERVMNTVPGISGGPDSHMRSAVTHGGYAYSKLGGYAPGAGVAGWGPVPGAGTTGGDGGTLPPAGDLPTDMKQRIEQAVKQADQSIRAVHASNNPILMSRFIAFNNNRIAVRTRAGVNDLADVIRRVFPTSR